MTALKSKKGGKKEAKKRRKEAAKIREKFEKGSPALNLSGIEIPIIKSVPRTTSNLKVVLTSKALAKIIGYFTSEDYEVSGFGTLTVEGGTRLVIDDIYFPEQEGSGSSTEISSMSLSKLINEFVDNGEPEKVDRLKVWIHTHPSFGTTPSTTDDNTIEESTIDFSVALVVNSKMEMNARLLIKSPVKILIDNIPIVAKMDIDEEIIHECRKEVHEKASKGVSAVVCGSGRSWPDDKDWHDGFSSKYGKYTKDPKTGKWIWHRFEDDKDTNASKGKKEDTLVGKELSHVGLSLNPEVDRISYTSTGKVIHLKNGKGIVVDDGAIVHFDKEDFEIFKKFRKHYNSLDTFLDALDMRTVAMDEKEADEAAIALSGITPDTNSPKVEEGIKEVEEFFEDKRKEEEDKEINTDPHYFQDPSNNKTLVGTPNKGKGND